MSTQQNDQKVTYKQIPLSASVYLRFTYLQKKGFPAYAERSIFRHTKKPLLDESVDKRKANKCRPWQIDEKDKQKVIASLKKLRKQKKEFCSVHIQQESGLDEIGNRTIRLCLNDSGYRLTGYHVSKNMFLLPFWRFGCPIMPL